jgi:hypothetical protein
LWYEQRALEIGITIAGGANGLINMTNRQQATDRLHHEFDPQVTEGENPDMVEHDMGVVLVWRSHFCTGLWRNHRHRAEEVRLRVSRNFWAPRESRTLMMLGHRHAPGPRNHIFCGALA